MRTDQARLPLRFIGFSAAVSGAGWLATWSILEIALLSAGLIGLAQWIVLRRVCHPRAWWIAGYAATWQVALYLGEWSAGPWSFGVPNIFVFGLAGGGTAGLLQWITLRHRVSHSWTWIPAQAVASFAGVWAGCFSGVWLGWNVFDSSPYRAAFAIGGTIAGLVTGAISGIVLVALSRQPGIHDRRWLPRLHRPRGRSSWHVSPFPGK
jgi:hypothetical protein